MSVKGLLIGKSLLYGSGPRSIGKALNNCNNNIGSVIFKNTLLKNNQTDSERPIKTLYLDSNL